MLHKVVSRRSFCLLAKASVELIMVLYKQFFFLLLLFTLFFSDFTVNGGAFTAHSLKNDAASLPEDTF